MSNSSIAKSFLMEVVSGKVREAYSKYISKDFTHHNPYFEGDRESLLLAMEKDAIENPGKKIEIKLTLEDGNLVTTYSHLQQKSEDTGIAVVHMFRFEDKSIVELWDIAVSIPENSPNKNGMF